MENINNPSAVDNSGILSVLAAALVSGQVDLSAISQPLQDKQKTEAAQVQLPATPVNTNASGTGCPGHSAGHAALSFYEWLTGNLETRFKHMCISMLGEHLLRCPNFPRSVTLRENCAGLVQLELTPEELEGFIRAWRAYKTYLNRLQAKGVKGST